MPYFNIAYLREEFDDCVCILNQADSAEAARAAFQARNPDIKIVDIWERKWYVPARSDGPLPTEAGRIEALEKRVAELERKLQDGHGIEFNCTYLESNAGAEENRITKIYAEILNDVMQDIIRRINLRG